MTNCPDQFQCSRVSTTERPVTDAAETDVKKASTRGVGWPDLVTHGSARNTVPTSEMMIRPETKSCAWRRAFARDSGLSVGREKIGGPPDRGTTPRSPPIKALTVRERVDCFIKTRDQHDIPFTQDFVACWPR
jgi:hypothetical protein